MKKRVTFWIFTVGLFVALVSFAYFSTPPKPTATVIAARDDLVKASRFSFGGVGIAAETTDEERWFFQILDSPRSYLVFRDVYDKGTPEAKAYAVAGLMQTHLGRGDDRIKDFGAASMTVTTQSGCIVSESLSGDVLLSLKSSDFDRFLEMLRP